MTLNSFVSDTEEEVHFIEEFCRERRCEFALSKVWEFGGEGGKALAEKVLSALETEKSDFHPIYETELPIRDKIETIAKEIYGAASVGFTAQAKEEMERLTRFGFDRLPICMAKTQYSLSDDAKLLGRPEGFEMTVREMYVSAGAGLIVAVTGSIMTMPGLSRQPAAYGIDVDDSGKITGLF